MGVSIHLWGPDGQSHPHWDTGSIAGNKQFAGTWAKHDLPYMMYPDPDHPLLGDSWRPLNFALWRATVDDTHNPGRFARMFDLLEADPTLWIYISW